MYAPCAVVTSSIHLESMYAGVLARYREVLIMKDVKYMKDRELLVELLGRDEAEEVHTKSLADLLRCECPHQSLRPLYLARELWERACILDLTKRTIFASPSVLKEYLLILFAPMRYEAFMVLYLDACHRLITSKLLFRGSLTQVSVYPRVVVGHALEYGASAVVLAHNHPSGDTSPSRADESLTQQLKAALALVDVRVLDHFIVGGGAAMSFAERGLI